MTLSPHTLTLQAFSYEKFDHFFGDTRRCKHHTVETLEAIHADRVEDCASDDEVPAPPANDFQWALWKAQYVESTVVIYGNDCNGLSTQVIVRGYRPYIRLLLPDESMSLTEARLKLHQFCCIAFGNSGQFKAVIQDHVLLDQTKFVDLFDFYIFNGNQRKRFLEVKFHSFAAYHHLRAVLENIWMLETHEIHSETQFDELQRQLRLERSRIGLDANGKPSEHKVKIAKTEKKEIQTHITKLENVIRAWAATRFLNGKALSWPMYDSTLDPVLDLLHLHNVKTQWIEIPLRMYTQLVDYETNLHMSTKQCSVIDFGEIKARNDLSTIAPFQQCSVDIETYSDQFHDMKNQKGRKFPEAKHAGSVIYQVALVVLQYGADTKNVKRFLITLGDPEELEEETLGDKDPQKITVHRMQNERELLTKTFDLIKAIDVDFFYTYNGESFDMHYLYQRGVRHGLVQEKDLWDGQSAPKAETKTKYHKLVSGGSMNDILSRSGKNKIQQQNSVFQTNAFGIAEYRKLLMPGRLHLDLLPYMRKNVKLQTYKLDFVAKHYLNEGKDDMKPEELHQAFQNQDHKELSRAGRYCIQDTALLQRLVSHPKTKIIENLTEMSRVCFVPIEFIISRGQQIKVFSQLAYEAKGQEKAIPHCIEDSEFTDNRLVGRLDDNGNLMSLEEDDDVDEDEKNDEIEIDESVEVTIDEGEQNDECVIAKRRRMDEQAETEVPLTKKAKLQQDSNNLLSYFQPAASTFFPAKPPKPSQVQQKKPIAKPLKQYEGATVIKPKVRAYIKNPIVTLDFASLYPGIIQYYNLDYSTIIKDKPKIERLRKEGFIIDVHEWKDRVNGVEFYVGIARRDPNGNEIKGTLPEMLKKLYKDRKAVKREMITEEDPARLAMLDAKQLAIKVSMNSAYGFCASNMMRCPTISALVCYLGRRALENTSELATATYGCTVVYGDTDSVFLDFTPEIGPPASMEMIFSMARDAASFLTYELFQKENPNSPMELEFEKVYHPFFLYSKKRYEGKKYEIHAGQTKALRDQYRDTRTKEELDEMIVIGLPKHDAKGVITNRRDGAKIASDLYGKITSHVLNGGRIEEAVAFVKDIVSRIRNDMIKDYNMFSLTQRINTIDSYQNPSRLAAVVVAQRMRDRGADVQPGSSVTYVYLDERDIQPLPELWAKEEKTLLAINKRPKAHRAEEAAYASAIGLRVDKINYIDTIQSAMKRFFGLFSSEIQKNVNDIYAHAKHLHQVAVCKSVSGSSLISTSNHTPWLQVPDGLCPWGGDDEGPHALGSLSTASEYVKEIVKEELKLFKKYLKEHEHMSADHLKMAFGPNVKQVIFGRAVIEMTSSSLYCPVHRHIHQRTLKNPTNIMHRVRISSTGIRYQCMRESTNESSSWPLIRSPFGMKQKPKFLPLRTPGMKAFLQKINQKLAAQEKAANASAKLTRPTETISPTNTDDKCLQLLSNLKRKREDDSEVESRCSRDKNSKTNSDDGIIDMGL